MHGQPESEQSQVQRGRFYVLYPRFPLVFFALSLAVVESIFAAMLVRCQYEAWAVVFLVLLMVALVGLVVAIVGLLVWKAPTHLMLTEQGNVEQPRRDERSFEEIVTRVERALVALRVLERARAQDMTQGIITVRGILQGEE